MKKIHYLIFLLSLFICLFTTVSAETSSKNVTVGDVDEPIYSVEIHWSDMSFDWKYDNYYKKHLFIPSNTCSPVTIDSERATELNSMSNAYLIDYGLYSDSDCTNRNTNTDYAAENTYYEISDGNKISIIDNSVNGRIKAKATFVPSTEYSWVSGVLADSWGCFQEDEDEESICSYVQTDENYTTLNAGFLPAYDSLQSGLRTLEAWMTLTYDSETVQSYNVTPDDLIGTVTLEISPDLE